MHRQRPPSPRGNAVIAIGLATILCGVLATTMLNVPRASLWMMGIVLLTTVAVAFLTRPGAKEIELSKLPSAKDVAIDALRRVGNLNHSGGIMLLDIGLLSYDGGPQPKVIRQETIPAYATQLRPFVLINFAAAYKPTFTLKFELVDEGGQVRFTAEESYQFQHGKNFCTPRNWLPMGDDEPGGNWSLRVNIADQPLAQHDFAIAPDTGSYFRTYLRPDGEIDEWLSKSATSVPTENVSLDDLLGKQD
jgi:hypothetical protein